MKRDVNKVKEHVERIGEMVGALQDDVKQILKNKEH